MRQGNQNNRNNRQRGRGRRPNNGGNPANKVYDSNGPDVRVRGSAQTVADKYLQLAGDAQSQGDRIKTESYFQHAEHYLRIVAANQAVKAQKQAEKDKAAEEHAARVQAKKEKTASEKPKKATETPAPAKTESEENDWGGHQPAFLQTGADQEKDTSKEAKPKSKGKKSAAKSNGSAKESSVDDASKEPDADVSAPAE